MTTSTFFPDPHVEVTTVDGLLEENDNTTDFDTIRGADGDFATDDSVTASSHIQTWNIQDTWNQIRRMICLFDTSAIGASSTVDSGTCEFICTSKSDDFTDTYSLVESDPATNTALVTGDYATIGTTLQATDIAISAINADDSTYNVWTLNSTGKASIAKAGITKFAGIAGFDQSGNEPTWASIKSSRCSFRMADTADTTSDIKLVITFTPGSSPTSIASSGII